MNIWNSYKIAVTSSFDELNCAQKDIHYWRDYLFVMAVLYILPLSLITLIPSVIVSLTHGYEIIAVFDFIAMILLLIIAFSSRVKIFHKKILLTSLIYTLGFVLLIALGSFGPGLTYLLAATIFMVIIFSAKYAHLTVALNTVFCIAYGVIIYFEFIEVPKVDVNQTLSWAAISVNLIFLSAVFSLLIPKMFNGLQKTIVEQIALKDELAENQKSLEKSLKVLEAKNSELEQFAYVISHDLQEPLRMISGFLTQLEKKYTNKLDEKARKYIFYAVEGAGKMRSIILNLLDFNQISRNNELAEKIDLNNLMQHLKQLYAFKINIGYENLPEIRSNNKLMTELFKNLLNNALKYSDPEASIPEVLIKAEEFEKEWQFSMKDNGIGIEKEGQKKIFVIFQRLHNQDKYEGLGMGLAIVKKIVEKMNGRVWVDSEPGKGSTFYFTISKMTGL